MIAENLTRWDTDDLVRLLELARGVAPAHVSKSLKLWANDETAIVFRHYSSTDHLVAARPHKRTNTGSILLRRPGRCDISVVDALATVLDDDDGGTGVGRMPPDMLEAVWLEAVAFMLTAYSGHHLKPKPVLPAGLQIRVARDRGKAAPRWVERQLEQARTELRLRKARWIFGRARLVGRIARLEAQLEKHTP